MAHGVLLSDAELAVMAQRGAAVAHCPLSNMFFAGRLLPVAELLRKGVKVRERKEGKREERVRPWAWVEEAGWGRRPRPPSGYGQSRLID